MADLVPAGAAPPGQSPATRQTFGVPAGAGPLDWLRGFIAHEPVRRVLPAFLGVLAIGGAALAWAALAPSEQRTLYSQLDDAERAGVAAALDQASINYEIDPGSGALTVDESDFYRARMLVASDGALATPESGTQLVDSLPMGASRMLEGERLRAAREHDLTLTIKEIDGVEAVRVHLAEGEKSVFVRENLPPSASVMVRLARGRQLSDSQVAAIVGLVAGSTPGLTTDAVRVVDQQGRLLSEQGGGGDGDRLDLQSRMEEKLRLQVGQLLAPMLGDGNFTSEIQVELDMSEVTSARESYDKEGVVRSVTEAQTKSMAPGKASGVPGVLANTPPDAAEARATPPEATAAPASGPGQMTGETSSSRTYELGREVSVANKRPGQVRRISVAVAISKAAMKNAKKADMAELEQLVGAAVGADAQRGDTVKVVARNFEPVAEEEAAFYETPWFATLVRYGASLLAVLAVLLLGVKPLIGALRRNPGTGEGQVANQAFLPGAESPGDGGDGAGPIRRALGHDGEAGATADPAILSEKVSLAKRLVAEKPDSAVAALRLMLAEPDPADQAGHVEKAA